MVPPHHEIIRQVLIRSGVSPGCDCCCFRQPSTAPTRRLSVTGRLFWRSTPGHRVAVVTSDFHTRRTRLVFRRACRHHAADIRFIGAPTDSFNGANWWRFETGFVYYVNEYLKLAKASLAEVMKRRTNGCTERRTD